MAGGCVSFAVQLAGHIVTIVFHSNSAAGYGQRVVDRSPMGIEVDVLRDVLRNYFVHIQGLVICGVPAGELVTRTGGIRDGSQIVFIDFFGLINRHHSVVGQVAALVGQAAAIGIKGHLAEVKKFASSLYSIVQYRIVFTQSICGGLVVLVVDDTSTRTIFQTVFERSQSSRERNGFQMVAFYKGIRFNFFYFFRDGDVRQILAFPKGILADRLNIFT